MLEKRVAFCLGDLHAGVVFLFAEACSFAKHDHAVFELGRVLVENGVQVLFERFAVRLPNAFHEYLLGE